MPRARFAASLSLLAAGVLAQEPTQVFRNLNGTFHVELPASWRQIAPNEARRVGEHANAPAMLRLVQPRHFYAVGPVDRWLAGDFSGPWLYVVEQDAEWFVADTFAADLRAMWDAETRASGTRHELADVQRAKVGTQQVEVVLATRTAVPPGGAPPVRSLDVHAPNGGRQVTLSFCCAPSEFAAAEPGFRAWLATLTFARMPRGQTSLGDRLWTPVLTGGAVALVLLLLYKHTRRTPQPGGRR